MARRDHTEIELQQKLKKRQFPDEEIERAVHQLTADGLQNNQRFAENYIHYRQNKGYGPLKIQAELMARGLSEELIEHLLNITDNAWFLKAREAWQKRFKGQVPDDMKNRARQMRFLQQRGFTRDQITRIFQYSD